MLASEGGRECARLTGASIVELALQEADLVCLDFDLSVSGIRSAVAMTVDGDDRDSSRCDWSNGTSDRSNRSSGCNSRVDDRDGGTAVDARRSMLSGAIGMRAVGSTRCS
jgi:hypothetical protein